jgi:hypothetical protein
MKTSKTKTSLKLRAAFFALTAVLSSSAFAFDGGDPGGGSNSTTDAVYGSAWGSAGSGRGSVGVPGGLQLNVNPNTCQCGSPGAANNWGLGDYSAIGDRG